MLIPNEPNFNFREIVIREPKGSLCVRFVELFDMPPSARRAADGRLEAGEGQHWRVKKALFRMSLSPSAGGACPEGKAYLHIGSSRIIAS